MRTQKNNRMRRRRRQTNHSYLPLESRKMLASLGNGEEALSSIAIGSQEEFQFEVNDAGTVRVSVGETGGNGFVAEPVLQIFDNAGNLVGSDFSNSDAAVQFSTLQTGTFTAVVTESGNDEPLEFRIRAISLPGTAQLIGERDDSLLNGEEVLSSIPLGTFATFPFQVNDAGTVRVSVGETGGSEFVAEPVLQIFDNNGDLVGSDFSNSDAAVQFSTFQTGTFTAIVSDSGNDESLEFRIRAVSLSEATQLIDERDDSLLNGEEVLSSIPLGTFATFPFQVDTAGTVRVSVGETGGSEFVAEPVLQIFDNAGNLVGSDFSNSDAAVQFSTFQTGTFTAIVSDSGNDESLEFRIRAISLSETTQLIDERDDSLLNGEEVLSSIPLGTFATFPFQVNDAGTVRVSVGETGGSEFVAEPVLQIFDNAGNLVGSDFSNSDAAVQFSTFQTGTFTAIVSDSGNDEPLEFRIRAISLPETAQLINERDDTLQNGEEVLSSIPLGSFATFPFQVDNAGMVSVSVGETGGSGFVAEPVLQIFDTNGNLVGSDFSNSDASVQFSTFQTGTFTAIVSDSGNDESLEFQIVATGISDDPVSSVLPGDVNLDGVVNFLDISPFISLLSAGEFQDEADVDGDGLVNFLDIAAFIQILNPS